MAKKELNLLGKDYFTYTEAAHYCCVSDSQFRDKCLEHGLFPFRFMGKQVFRKADCQRAMEKEATECYQNIKQLRSSRRAMRGVSTGARAIRASGRRSV